MSNAKAPSIDQLERDIADRRGRLAGTVDELTRQAAPKAIAQRQVDSAKAAFNDATRTPEGNLRVERVAALALVGVALVGFGIWRRRRGV